jgi:hypothetical protein
MASTPRSPFQVSPWLKMLADVVVQLPVGLREALKR